MKRFIFLFTVSFSCASPIIAQQINTLGTERSELDGNQSLAATLDSIYHEDQYYRLQMDSVRTAYGGNSKEMRNIIDLILRKDSANLLVVTEILDKYGWLGPNVVGQRGNSTLFLVIQHANQATQEKYLPMMREAVRQGNASASSLALLEDRVALGQGKEQIYGSQVGIDSTDKYFVRPLADPATVDKRRAQVGLPPLAEYLKLFNLTWDVEDYLQKQAEIEAAEARLHQR